MKKPKWLQKGLCCALAICILLLGTGMAEPLTMESEFAQESLLSAEGRDISRLTLESIPDSLIQTVGIESAAEGQRAVALEASDADSLHSFTTVNEDGSRSVYSFAQPVKYVDQKTNRIEFIDNDWRAVGFFDSLFSGEAYVNASNDVRVAVSGDIRNGVVMEWNAQALDNEPEVSPQAGDELTQSAEGAQTVRQSVASSDDVSRDYTFRMTPQTEASARAARDPGSSYVRYDGAFGEGTRLEYKAAHRGVKENLVLERNPGVNEFCFAIEAPGLVPDVMQGDAICFQDAQTGEPVVTLSPPWATDSHTGESDELPVNDSESEISDEQTLSDGDNQAIQTQAQSAAAQVGADPHLCFNLGYRLEAAGEGKYRLTLTIDPDYLNDPTTVYPVVIDPTVFTYANDIPYVTLFSDGSRWDVLGCVGNASGKEAMMYFKMPNMSQYKYINPNNVVSASVVMTQRVGSEDNYAVDLHDSLTGVSIAAATYSTVANNLGNRISTVYCGANDTRYVWNFKAIFVPWLQYEIKGEGWTSYQFMIKARDTGKNCKYFDTSDDENCFYMYVMYNEDRSVSDGVYFIRGVKEGRYLDHHMGENRTTAWTMDGTPNQRWKIAQNADGTYSLRPMDNTGLGLEVYCAANTNEQPITQYNYDSSIYYKWRLVSNNDGTYRIMPAISNTKGLDVYNDPDTTKTFNGRSFPKRRGIDVQLFEYGGSANQKWYFVSTFNSVTGVHMSNLAGTSTIFFNTISSLGTSLGSAPCAKLVDSSASDVWKLMQSSGIFIFNGHGEQTSISCGGGSSTLTRDYVLSQPAGSLSNCRLVVYNCCLTARGGTGAANLAQATQSRGAQTVVGFKESVYSNRADTWMEGFCQAIAGGETVIDACQSALNYVRSRHGVNDTGFTESYDVFGNVSQRLK